MLAVAFNVTLFINVAQMIHRPLPTKWNGELVPVLSAVRRSLVWQSAVIGLLSRTNVHDVANGRAFNQAQTAGRPC